MTNPIRNGEWRLYLRDHKWWWKWPLVAITMAVWLGAMVLFVAPWQSNDSIDLSQPEPVSTTDTDESATVGVREALDDDFTADPLPEVDDVDAAAPPESSVESSRAETEPPADTEVPTDTAASKHRGRRAGGDRVVERAPATPDGRRPCGRTPAGDDHRRHRPAAAPAPVGRGHHSTSGDRGCRPTHHDHDGSSHHDRSTDHHHHHGPTHHHATTHDAAAATTHDAAADHQPPPPTTTQPPPPPLPTTVARHHRHRLRHRRRLHLHRHHDLCTPVDGGA